MVHSAQSLRFHISGNLEESSMCLTARPARRDDAPAITEIYNQGIEDRIATFETEPREVADVLPWFDHARAFVSVTEPSGEVVGYAVAHPYSDRCCYRGIGEFSVYVRRARGAGRRLVVSRTASALRLAPGDGRARQTWNAPLVSVYGLAVEAGARRSAKE
jgi:hypothetical protein